MPTPTPKAPLDFRSKLANAKRPERVVRVFLNGDLAAQIDDADADLRRISSESDDRLGGNPAERKLATHIEALRQEMQESEQAFRLRAMSRRRWTEFLTEHPARKDDEADANFGLNRATVWDALVRESIIDPELADDDWETLLDKLNSAQFEKLSDASWALNRGEVDIPFSARAFTTLQRSGETSKPQPAGE